MPVAEIIPVSDTTCHLVENFLSCIFLLTELVKGFCENPQIFNAQCHPERLDFN